jgi:DNA-binding protein HU-beta
MAKMSKSQMLAALADKAGVSKKQAAALVDAMVDLALTEVKKAGVFVLPGIGKLVKVNRKARMGRNPATGASIKIPAKTVVKFRVAKAAKEAVL